MWYYTINGQQLGPLDDTALDQSIATGVITADTLVWKEGLAAWTPLGQVARAPAATVAPAPAASLAVAAPGVCSMCGKPVGADNLIDLVGHRVCGACKPTAVQMLREGVAPAPAGSAWSEGKSVVTHDKAELPARCFKCNAPALGAPLKRKVQWHNPLWYLTIFAGLLIYVVVAIVIRKTAAVEIHLCDYHLARRKKFVLWGWVGALVSLFVIPTIGIVRNEAVITVAGFLLFLVAIIAGVAGANITRAKRIKDKTVWLSGAGKDFIDSLPRWPGPA